MKRLTIGENKYGWICRFHLVEPSRKQFILKIYQIKSKKCKEYVDVPEPYKEIHLYGNGCVEKLRDFLNEWIPKAGQKKI